MHSPATDSSIRPYHPSDLPSLYRICHATGWNGRDASAQVADPDLIGHSYVGPYAVLEPEHCFVGLRGGQVAGYIVATADSAAFHHRCEEEWFPVLRSRYPLSSPGDHSATAIFTRTLHAGHPPSSQINLSAYPASLHIDLLPCAQGQGLGRQLITRLFSELREKQIPGVHLYAGTANLSAIGFYERIGFSRIDENPHAVGFGYDLS